MPKFGFINGSPRPVGSLSRMMIDTFIQELHLTPENYSLFDTYKLNGKSDYSLEYASLLECDTIIVVTPLYIDSLPATLLQFLHGVEKYQATTLPSNSPTLYGFTNCGFIDGFQNHIALNILENYAARMNWSFGGGMGFGSGEMFRGTKNTLPKEAKIVKPLYDAFDTFTTCLATQTPIPTTNKQILVNEAFSQSLFLVVASFLWLPQAFANKVGPIRLFSKPYKLK